MSDDGRMEASHDLRAPGHVPPGRVHLGATTMESNERAEQQLSEGVRVLPELEDGFRWQVEETADGPQIVAYNPTTGEGSVLWKLGVELDRELRALDELAQKAAWVLENGASGEGRDIAEGVIALRAALSRETGDTSPTDPRRPSDRRETLAYLETILCDMTGGYVETEDGVVLSWDIGVLRQVVRYVRSLSQEEHDG